MVRQLKNLIDHGESIRPTISTYPTPCDSTEVFIGSQEYIPSISLPCDELIPLNHRELPAGVTLSTESCDFQPIHPDATCYPLDDKDQPKYKLKSTARVMRQALVKQLPPLMEFRLHLDGGANMSVTSDQSLLINFKNIKKHAIAGIAQGEAAIYATGLGYLPWRAATGETLLVKCFYSAQAADTIISPTDVVINQWSDYNAWSQYANVDEGCGYVAFHRRHDQSITRFNLVSQNGLWFYYTAGFDDFSTCRFLDADTGAPVSTIHRLTKTQEHLLWHKRLGCPGETNSKELHKHVIGCPVLKRNAFFKCKYCMQDKATYRPMPSGLVKLKLVGTPSSDQTGTETLPADVDHPESMLDAEVDPEEPVDPRDIPAPDLQPGQMFQMDMGFVRGSGYSTKDEDGRRITSLDGYNSYLIIVDRKTRRHWVFLTKSKSPPIQFCQQFLQQNKCRFSTRKIIRSDQGGELYRSTAFQEMTNQEGFILQPTATDASFQNGLAERPNRTLAETMRCLLHNAGLGPQYWSWALTHSVYLKNRLPHRAIGCTPYEAWSGKKPNVSKLRIFGSPVIVRLPGPRPAKLDHHTTHGLFLGYTATDHNIYYQDYKTKRVKIATHVTFDEAGYTLPSKERSLGMLELQDIGIPKDDDSTTISPAADNSEPPRPVPLATDTALLDTLQVKLLSDKARLPVRATHEAAGYDLHSAVSLVIAANDRASIATDISIRPPNGTYAQIASRSGLACKFHVDAKAGVIDRDYRGNLVVLLHNCSNVPFQVNVGDRVAQLILHRIAEPQVMECNELDSTARAQDGFGSTGIATIRQSARIISSVEPATLPPETVLDPNPTSVPPQTVAEFTEQILQEDGIKPYDIWLSSDPFDNSLNVSVAVKGDHPTLGFTLISCTARNRLQLKDMVLSTPGARVPKWRSTLRNSYLLQINGSQMNTIDDVHAAISAARQQKLVKIHCVFATEKSYGVNPIDGNLTLFYDQMDAIAKHVQAADKAHIANNKANLQSTTFKPNSDSIPVPAFIPPEPPEPTNDPIIRAQVSSQEALEASAAIDPDLGQSFTLKQLLKRADYPEWKRSQYKQLDQYDTQGMFGDPMSLPRGSGASFMLWNFMVKMCGTKKARMVFDGARNREYTTSGYTYANSVDAPSERLFWALVAKLGLTAIGADVSNAFAEASGPVEPVYMYIDDTYREWWTVHKGRPPIPNDCNVVRVWKAIQGHPESPRLWERHIDNILRQAGFKPTTHEPCLYGGTVDGHLVLFLRQVDDFSVAAKDRAICSAIISYINSKMSMDVKDLGLIDRFNGMDIFQTKYYVKITCEKYLAKMLQAHQWSLKAPPPTLPIPLPADKEFIKQLEEATPPSSQSEIDTLRQEMGFNYRQVLGEIIWPMIKCRPDISPHAIKLSQYLDNPAREHYHAAKLLVDYLAATITEGIYYWRDEPVDSLPEGDLPTLHADNHTLSATLHQDLTGFVDSDWAGDTIRRKSISGIAIMLAGGVVAYKSKRQEVIALSTTEAEFVAACDAGKVILFFRSILEDLGIPQDHATVLYEDNMGALLMANAKQPTRRTRHMDIKHFSLLDWVERDLVLLQTVTTHDNAADAMTKFLPKQLFYRHFDTYMGRRIPKHLLRILDLSSVHKSHCSLMFSSSHYNDICEHGEGARDTRT